MGELTIEQKAKLYDEVVNKLKGFMAQGVDPLITRADVQDFFPELKESDDERIRKGLIAIITDFESLSLQKNYSLSREDMLAWLEKQGEHSVSHLFTFEDVLTIQCAMAYAKFQDRELDVALKKLHDKVYDAYHDSKNHHIESQDGLKGEQKPCMIQWKGDNLKEVIDFTGKDKNFDKWFKSFEEYEKFVREHEGILKLFNEDGSHYEVPVGAWIVKTPDGRNVASKAVFKKMPAWGEEDKEMSRFIGNAITANDASEYLGSKGIQVIDVHVWLYELKDRVQPQSNHWKPSDEQMDALNDVISSRDIKYDVLSELWKDLKKLRKEKL